VSNTENKELIRLMRSLCNYVTYRLLANMCPQKLGEKTVRRNKLLRHYFVEKIDVDTSFLLL
jgi:hypothetical protein